MVKEENIGEVVKYEDTTQLARVMESVLVNRSLQDIYRKNIKKIRSKFFWENVTRPLVKYCRDPQYAVDKKKTYGLVELQNSRLNRLIKERFEGCTNVLMITRNKLADKNIIADGEVGKMFYLEVDDQKNTANDGSGLDEIGDLKARITQRTKFDGIIVSNAYQEIQPRFFYDLINVISGKLKKGGLLFLSLPEDRGLLQLLGRGKAKDRTGIKIDDFTMEYILKDSGFSILDHGDWDSIEKVENIIGAEGLGEVYGKNELFELFEIGLDRSKFEELELLSRFDILESEEFAGDKTCKGEI